MKENIIFTEDQTEELNKYKPLWNIEHDQYLIRLLSECNINKLIPSNSNDFEKIQIVTNYVHNLWKHNGVNAPEKNDPISILQDVKKGDKFRCVEYSIVLNGCLNALGIISRILSLKTKNCETKRYGAGHVVVEAYLKDKEKWVMIDPQWDVIPMFVLSST